MQNPDTVKKALLQTILAFNDATSLPWPAVRAAYGTSMHEIESGNLSWGTRCSGPSIDFLHHKSLWQTSTPPQISQIIGPKHADISMKVCVASNHTMDSTDMFVHFVQN